MAKVSFKGIGELVVTFKANLTKESEGKLVKMKADSEVELCGDGDIFLGKILKYEDRGTASTQIGGYVEAIYSGTAPDVGFTKLVADATGGVKVDAANGREVKVVKIDTTKKIVGFFI
ncbi:hypothetical protein ACR77J_17275 [Tissierella praeacuta]|uniref:hypothetical protein n=1 Tax=Tissierella TaxID=41273 RepID=UPI00306C1565